MIMKKVSILVSTIDSGGAEKQAVLLAIQLSKHTDVNLIVLYGGHTEYKGNVDLLTKSSVKVHRLNGSMLLKTIRIRELLKESTNASCATCTPSINKLLFPTIVRPLAAVPRLIVTFSRISPWATDGGKLWHCPCIP